MFPGTKVTIGGKDYVIPALSLAQLRNGFLQKIKQHDEFVENKSPYEAVQLRGEVVLAALRRNYPDIKDEEILDALDVRSADEGWLAALGVSKVSQVGEDTAAGAGT